MNIDVQISWQAHYFVDLEAQFSWQAQRFVNLAVQISWQAQRFVDVGFSFNFLPSPGFGYRVNRGVALRKPRRSCPRVEAR